MRSTDKLTYTVYYWFNPYGDALLLFKILKNPNRSAFSYNILGFLFNLTETSIRRKLILSTIILIFQNLSFLR